MPSSRQSSVVSRVQLGTVVPLTPEEIAALALITPEDVERAKREVIPELRELLEAVPVKQRNPKGPFRVRPAQRSN